MVILLQRSAFLEAIQKHDPSSTAIIHDGTHSYGSLLLDVCRAKERLLQKTGRHENDLSGERVSFLVENGYEYTVTLLAILACNAIAVPLAVSFPIVGLRQIVDDSGAVALLCSPKYAKQASGVLSEGFKDTVICYQVDKLEENVDESLDVELGDMSPTAAGGMMLFTSGTTARPKGVLLSVATLTAQAQSLIMAWEYTTSDHLLHVLPLHHIHGTVNALLTPLLAGSSIEFMFPFHAEHVWKRLAEPFLSSKDVVDTRGNSCSISDKERPPISFFTAVPTVWARLLQAYSSLSPELQKAGREAISRDHLRLNISGSAALPKPIRDGWTELSRGNILLERYGMTEVGMALSCGLHDTDRIDNCVGWPVPFVEARLWETNDTTGEGVLIALGEEVDPITGKDRQGEIQLRGSTVFREYWRNRAATEKEFTHDGWFKTGDIATRCILPGTGNGRSGSWARGPAYFIQGRQSADIIKTGGEKVSALEIERELLALPEVSECAVVGLPSEAWGQKVVAVVVVSEACEKNSKLWGVSDMRRALKERLVAYKIPQDLQIVGTIKRNAMGKVNKKELIPAVFGSNEEIRRRSITIQEKRKT